MILPSLKLSPHLRGVWRSYVAIQGNMGDVCDVWLIVLVLLELKARGQWPACAPLMLRCAR